jgi:hypothetical protein
VRASAVPLPSPAPTVATLAPPGAVVLAGGRYRPTRLALDADHAYWIELDGRLGQVPRAGGEARLLVDAPKTDVSDVATDETHVYWAWQGGVSRVRKAGGEPERFMHGRADRVLLLGDDVYWVAHDATGAIEVQPKAGGPRRTVATVGDPYDLSTDGQRLYVSDWGRGNLPASGGIAAIPKGGGAPVWIAQRREHPAALVVDATHAYWIEDESLGSTTKNRRGVIWRAAKTGGDDPVRLHEAYENLTDLALDHYSVYATVFSSDISRRDGKILRIPKRGGYAAVVVKELPSPSNLLVTPDAFFFTTYGTCVNAACVDDDPSDDGALMRAPRGR